MKADTTSLPAKEARRLESLIARAEFFELQEDLGPATQADRFQYTLTAEEEGGRKHTVTFSEENAPPPLLELARSIEKSGRLRLPASRRSEG